MKKKSGIVIYQPSGKAAEYSNWACNLYNGCTNQCTYCYNRKGLSHNRLGKPEVTPKKEWTADELFEQFTKEADKWNDLIIHDGGLHFNFVSDPCLTETYRLNLRCIKYAIEQNIPVRMLTKMHDWIGYPEWQELLAGKWLHDRRQLISFGFTLTGMDIMEPGASSNDQRVATMRKLYEMGYNIWASIEPVIDIQMSYIYICKAWNFCDEFRIGLLSGKKSYKPDDIQCFIDEIKSLNIGEQKNIIYKNSVLRYLK